MTGKESPSDDGIFLCRTLINEVHERANKGWELALRRIAVDEGKYAMHHEDYLPMFKEISALCINRSSILKRESQLQNE